MRGEHPRNRTPRKARAGSSPHARGARGGYRAALKLDGIIPACAGSTIG